MQWWIYVLIVLGVVVLLAGLLILIRVNNSKEVKFKIPKVEKEEKPEPIKEEVKVEEFPNLIFDEFGGQEEKLLSSVKEAKEEEYDPFEFDDVINEEDERRYREFMSRHESKGRKSLSEDEEFEKFRNEHCYSKYLTDPELLNRLVNVPEEMRPIILADLFKSINLDDINSKSI